MIRRHLASQFLILIITGIALFSESAAVLAQAIPSESCQEPLTCTCDGASYTEVQEAMMERSDVATGSDACEKACSEFGSKGIWEIFCQDVRKNQGGIPLAGAPTEEKKEYQVPILAVPIPGLVFTPAEERNGEIASNYLGQYIRALYSLIIVIATIGAVLTTMIAGLKWMVARGNPGAVSTAKEEIGTALVSIFILLGIVSLVNLIDPSLTSISGLRLPIIERIEIAYSDGEEGAPSGSGGAITADCLEAVQNAKANSACSISGGVKSPTGNPYSCNYHFRDADYNYAKIKALDYPAEFGQAIYAPFSGTVNYVQGTGGDRCGNRIRLTGKGGSITMCHIKNFLDNSGQAIRSGTQVQQGDVIGHVGGACCSGQNPPSEWSQSKKCTVAGTPCTDPNKNETCQCQPYTQSGNTSGPHVHITFTSSGYLLSCVE